MPTPSSRDENDSANYNSSCPDDQAPRAQSGWAHTSQSPYEEGSHAHPDIAVASGIGSSHSQPTSAIDEDEEQEQPQSPSPAQSPPTMSPAPPLNTSASRPAVPETESVYLNATEEQDDPADPADKPSDTDEDMPDSHTPGTTSDSHDDRSDINDPHSLRNMIPRSSLPGAIRINSREVARYSIPEMEIWEPYGTSHSLRRQAEAAHFADNRRSATSADALSQSSMDGEMVDEQDVEEEAELSEYESYTGFDPTYSRVSPIISSTVELRHYS